MANDSSINVESIVVALNLRGERFGTRRKRRVALSHEPFNRVVQFRRYAKSFVGEEFCQRRRIVGERRLEFRLVQRQFAILVDADSDGFERLELAGTKEAASQHVIQVGIDAQRGLGAKQDAGGERLGVEIRHFVEIGAERVVGVDKVLGNVEQVGAGHGHVDRNRLLGRLNDGEVDARNRILKRVRVGSHDDARAERRTAQFNGRVLAEAELFEFEIGRKSVHK